MKTGIFFKILHTKKNKTIKGRRKNAEETDEIIWQTLMAEEAVGYMGV